MVELRFGQRLVGTVSLDGGTGIGKFLYDNGIDSLVDLKHFGQEDGEAFLSALTRMFVGEYFSASKAG